MIPLGETPRTARSESSTVRVHDIDIAISPILVQAMNNNGMEAAHFRFIVAQ